MRPVPVEKQLKLFYTEDYGIFKRLDGNRQDIERRKKNVIASIKRIGYIPTPIICNEFMQVVDGQARLEACTELKIAVAFIVVPGIGIKECREMNLKQSNWTVKDFIDSYAENGDASYIYLKNLMKEYGGCISATTIISIVIDRYGNGSNVDGRRLTLAECVKSGTIHIDQDKYEQTRTICEYLKKFSDIANVKDAYMKALRFAYSCEGIDNERLYNKAVDQKHKFVPAATIEQAISVLEHVYNYRSQPSNKFYLATEYEKEMAIRRSISKRRYYEGGKS